MHTPAGFTTKLSSAGLVYKHYGREIVAGIMGLSPDHADAQTVYLKVYKNFMEAIDAIDNGTRPQPTSLSAIESSCASPVFGNVVV